MRTARSGSGMPEPTPERIAQAVERARAEVERATSVGLLAWCTAVDAAVLLAHIDAQAAALAQVQAERDEARALWKEASAVATHLYGETLTTLRARDQAQAEAQRMAVEMDTARLDRGLAEDRAAEWARLYQETAAERDALKREQDGFRIILGNLIVELHQTKRAARDRGGVKVFADQVQEYDGGRTFTARVTNCPACLRGIDHQHATAGEVG